MAGSARAGTASAKTLATEFARYLGAPVAARMSQ